MNSLEINLIPSGQLNSNKMKEIQLKVSPFSEVLEFYTIHYRPVKKHNVFNFWMRLDVVRKDLQWHPSLHKKEVAIELANRFKADPDLIDVWEMNEYEKLEEYRKEKKNQIIII